MLPVIGLTPSLDGSELKVAQDYVDAVLAAGGVPFIIPYLSGKLEIQQVSEMLDGIILTGGGDIDPTLFGEEPIPQLGSIDPLRDDFEVKLIQNMLQRNKPMLGICRGCQILNVAVGGDMFQDLETQFPAQLLQHTQNAPRSHRSHYVHIAQGSRLFRIMQERTTIKVNSFHHQAVRRLAGCFVQSAVSSDGVMEAFESDEHSYVIGVQWHPENLAGQDEFSKALFASLIAACQK
jgi:putative glutamine amidotransferase